MSAKAADRMDRLEVLVAQLRAENKRMREVEIETARVNRNQSARTAKESRRLAALLKQSQDPLPGSSCCESSERTRRKTASDPIFALKSLVSMMKRLRYDHRISDCLLIFVLSVLRMSWAQLQKPPRPPKPPTPPGFH